MFSNSKKTAFYLFIVAVFLFVFDRFLKLLALNYHDNYSLLGDILQFSFAKNYNIAFSLPFGGSPLIVLIITIILVLVGYIVKLAKNKEWMQLGLLTNVLFGAISNLLDRFKYGYVVDYIDLKYFTVFNLADMMIVGGVCFILLFSINNKKI